jgi:hypothetical protein
VSDDYGLTASDMSFRNFTVRHARSKRSGGSRQCGRCGVPPTRGLLHVRAHADGHIGLAGMSFQEADVRQWLARSHLRLECGTSQQGVMEADLT